MSDLPEIPRRVPRHWLEYVTTGVAVVISVISLWVAIGSEDANRKMVAASSWPFLEVGSSSVDGEGRSVLTFSVTNSGVGPAKVRTFEVFFKGKPYRTAVDLVRACCNASFQRKAPSDDGKSSSDEFITGDTAGIVIRAGEIHNFIIYGLSPRNVSTWHALDRARQKDIKFRICYCSVFDECWLDDVKGVDQLDPMRVDKCPVPKLAYTE